MKILLSKSFPFDRSTWHCGGRAAWHDAGLHPDMDYDPHRVAIVVGSAMGGVEMLFTCASVDGSRIFPTVVFLFLYLDLL